MTDEAIRQAMASIENRIRHIYNQCYEDGRKSVQNVGKWIDEGWYADGHSEHAFHCSVCGGHIIDYVCQVYDENPHCKWCGAEMVEEGAEE